MPVEPQIAIVGLGGLFPGARSLDKFWANISHGIDTSREVPPGRWLLDPADTLAPGIASPDHVHTSRGYYLDEIPLPTEVVGIDRELLVRLDPIFHLILHAGSQAFAEAATPSLDRKRVGVILGHIALPTEKASALAIDILGLTFAEKLGIPLDREKTEPLNRWVAGLPAGVLATALGLCAGWYTLDAACASSLYTVKLAADELRAGRADLLLAGGASRPDCLYTQMGFAQLRALSPSGRCSPFDAAGDGLVVGEGCGILALKRLDDAVKDGNTIYAVIAGAGLSNDVEGSLLAPASEGQLRAMRDAYRQAGWSPADVDLIECHATGTPVGDAVEFASLKSLWKDLSFRPGQCVIGSVKSTVGHLLTGAGSAGLIKLLQAMRHGILPPTANFRSPQSQVNLDASPFRILQKSEAWPRRTTEMPRRAAISGFGFGGINAHLLLEEFIPTAKRTQIAVPSQPQSEPVAIVGMEARFGPWQSLRLFEKRVLGLGGDVSPSPNRHDWGVLSSNWARQLGVNSDAFNGYFIDEIEVPLDQFRIPPKELEEMLPQQLLMLQVAAAALADAKCWEEYRQDAGVFLGLGLDLNTTNFHFRWWALEAGRAWRRQCTDAIEVAEFDAWIRDLRNAVHPALNANRTMGALGSIAASRVARAFQFGGSSFTICSEDTSGGSALEAAIRALRNRELDLALAGAVDLTGDIRAMISTVAGVSQTADANSRPIFGEGAAAVVLKRLSDAKQDGDRIYAIVTGIGSACGGRFHSLSPDKQAAAEAVRRARADAKDESESIGYFELSCLDNPRSLNEAVDAIGVGCDAAAILGSASAQIGHTGAASFMASLVKSCLALHRSILPAAGRLQEDKELVNKGRVLRKPRFWLMNRDDGPRRAGVTSHGIGGNCVHAVIEEYRTDAAIQMAPVAPLSEMLFTFCGESPNALLTDLGRLEASLGSDSIEQAATKWQSCQADSKFGVGAAIVASSIAELKLQFAVLRDHLKKQPNKPLPGDLDRTNGRDGESIFYAPAPLGRDGQIAFVYPGSGNHFAGMGRDLAVRWPHVLRRQQGENLHLAEQFNPRVIWDDRSGRELDPIDALLGQVTLGCLVTDLLQSFDLKPHAAIGLSLGETASLFALRAWKDRDEILRRMYCSTLFRSDLAGQCDAARQFWNLSREAPFEWAIGSFACPADRIRKEIMPGEKAYLLIVSHSNECVVGGDRRALDSLVQRLGVRFIPLPAVSIAHCELVGPVAAAYRELHRLPTSAPPGIRFYSGASGSAYKVTSESAADAILGHALNPIDFPRLIERAYSDGIRLFVEIGPGDSCSRMIRHILGDRPHVARSACVAQGDAVGTLLRLLATLHVHGVRLDLSPLVLSHEGEATKSRPTLKIMVGRKPLEIPPPPSPRLMTSSGEDSRSERSRIAAESDARRQNTTFASSDGGHDAGISAGTESAGPGELREIPSARPNPRNAGKRETINDLLATSEKAFAATAEAQAEYLRFHESGVQLLSRITEFSNRFLGQAFTLPESDQPAIVEQSPALDTWQCQEFAVGSIARVLGPEFAEIDSHPTRVRLPDGPLMLVDHIIAIEGDPRSLGSGRVITDHLVHRDRWYIEEGHIPTAICVEAGQADLFLSGYLGIDFVTEGLAVYRLLDAVVTFHRELPKPGELIRYDIQIDRFFRQGETHLFRFRFEGSVDGEPLLTMRDGCAGFFTSGELAAGKGIVKTALDRRPIAGKRPTDWRELAPIDGIESYDDGQIRALRLGNLEACFGTAFSGLDLRQPLTLPDGMLKLVDRVVEFDPKGGRYGLGRIQAEMDIHPDDWFLTCHFVDDMVMPGTLMYECCLHTLRIFLLRMGWVGEKERVSCEPIPGVPSQLKCRGQVIATTKTVTYEVSIKELEYAPEPRAICDALMYADGKPVVEISNMTLRMTGTNRDEIERLWQARKKVNLNSQHDRKAPLFDRDRILAFAIGKPSDAFGDRYRVFDSERVIARLPGPPYQFLDRITEIRNCQPWELAAGGEIVAEYDVPPDEWYFAANRQSQMPFCVLLEIALQPCGWLAAYLGSALTSEQDLSFRNLGGTATIHEPIGPEVGTLTTDVKITRVSSSGGMIIQNYDLRVRAGNRTIYDGNTVFGFFSKTALSQQVGIRDAKPFDPPQDQLARSIGIPVPDHSPFPAPPLRMMDNVEIFTADGGSRGLGWIRGGKKIDPNEWFFKAHFYQDPVWPGSLGLEAFLQLLKIVAVRRWGQPPPSGHTLGLNQPHTWIYRGQVIPNNDLVKVEAEITAIDDQRRLLRADGYLTVDGRTIYQMKDFTLQG
jgi:PfaB family protein